MEWKKAQNSVEQLKTGNSLDGLAGITRMPNQRFVIYHYLERGWKGIEVSSKYPGITNAKQRLSVSLTP